MELFHNGDHLQVQKPLTTDGINLVLVDGRVKKKTVYLPITAKKNLEQRNAKLPDNLKMDIKVVPGRVYTAPVDASAELQSKNEALEKRIAELEAAAKKAKTKTDDKN